jgi:membrane-associated phospholipid phosphatase
VLVGASRVYLGVHWLTDVLAAATMSIAVLALWNIAHRTLSPTEPPAPKVGIDHPGGGLSTRS